MRAIKFRAWDGEVQSMIYDKDPGWVLRKAKDMHDWKVMQYTGLTDKNGVEIYEGDILHWTISHDDPEVAEINQGNFAVIWRFGSWCLDLPAGVPVPRSTNLWKVIDDVEEDRGSLEIIGNIYSNPELLS